MARQCHAVRLQEVMRRRIPGQEQAARHVGVGESNADQKHPDCHNCTRKGLQCVRETTLKWQAEYESQGLAFGRAGVWSKRGSTLCAVTAAPTLALAIWTQVPEIRPYHFIHYVPKDIEDGESTESLVRMDKCPVPRLERPLQLLPQMNMTVDASILTYYVEKLCPLTTLSNERDSPFLSMILPYLPTASPAVLDATLALAARHISRTNEHWESTASRLEFRATNALRTRIATLSPMQVAQDPEVAIIAMMLCLYEIVSQCDIRWVVHLKGARDIARLRRMLANPATHDLQAFADRFFAFQDAIGRTACANESVFGHAYWDAEDQNVDTWLGCSPALVSIICSITDLSRKRQHMLSSDFQTQADALEIRLNMLQQTTTGDQYLDRSAEVKLQTAKLLLRCALFNADPSASLVRQSVAHIIHHIKWFADRERGAGLLWPLFVAAVELDPLNDTYIIDDRSLEIVHGRAFVLRALEVLQKTSVSNVDRIRQVIVEVWQARDDALDSPRDSTWLNDWDTYITPRSANISLA